jgi:hypothetical protein
LLQEFKPHQNTPRSNRKRLQIDKNFQTTSKSLDELSQSMTPKLTKSCYRTIPSIEEMKLMDVSKLERILDFTVICEGLGSVCFPTPTDVRSMNLDDIIEFPRHGTLDIYPEAKFDKNTKPEVGKGLNKCAIITFENVWPRSKGELTNKDFDEKERKLKQMASKHDTDFIEYDRENGRYTFKVKHFSIYTVSDSEDEEEAEI